ncbi:FMN-dependent NADH-azoreductase [Caulobacter sp. S45]|uniref:FMN-dependent NADH-azoreductase n=1 Tax=Caulobacter sp. S45 TaxID=1641861 RepID=UPI00131C5A06|nr:FMN-dependent NADH-azoreductase [Caulobacter sp. S45]
MKLLHIDTSILGANSVSRQIAGAVVDRLRQANPGLEVSTHDLAAEPLAHLSLSNLPSDHPIAASMGGAQDERAASQSALDAFLAADVVVIGAPMYNFTIPSQLKAWIDCILIPGKTFQYGPEGVKGLAGGKRVIIAISRGGLYGPGAPAAAAEHLETYLRTVFGFIGVADLEIIVAEGIQMGPEHRSKAVEAALRAATELRAA